MSDRVDIHDPIFELCGRLGLVPENVGQIIFEPAEVKAKVYLLDDSGHKYVNQDTGEAAVEYLNFLVKT